MRSAAALASLSASDWFASLNLEAGAASLSAPHSRNYSGAVTRVITYQHPVYSITGSRRVIGYLLADMDSAITQLTNRSRIRFIIVCFYGLYSATGKRPKGHFPLRVRLCYFFSSRSTPVPAAVCTSTT